VATLRRDRVGWWGFIAVLGAAAAYIGYAFVDVIALGVFGYYATRPICRRLEDRVDSKQLAAMVTALAILLPILALTSYALFQLYTRFQQAFGEGMLSMLTSQLFGSQFVPESGGIALGSLVRNPPSVSQLTSGSFWGELQQGLQVLGTVFNTLLVVALALTLSYALLHYDDALSEVYTKLVGGHDTTAYGYAVAVDADLESVFFGNLLFVVIMAVVATVTYAATNLLAPAGLAVPMVFVLGFLTGAASLIPIVVGKIVYLPVVGLLAFQASQSGGASLAFVGAVLVAYVLVLDVLPQSFIQPYVSGRDLNMLLLLFAYVLGPMLFGWYGFFLLPIVFILLLEVVRIVLPELIHGQPLFPEASVADGLGTDPEEESDDIPDVDQAPPSGDGSDAAEG